ALCTVTVASLVSSITTARAQYAIDFVITPYKPGIVDSWFFGINNRGQTTGYVTTLTAQGTAVQSSMIYRDGDIRALFTGSATSDFFTNTGLAINNRGDVVGMLDSQPTLFAHNGGQTPILTPGLASTSVRGLNDSGTVLLSVPSNLPTVSARFGLWDTRG